MKIFLFLDWDSSQVEASGECQGLKIQAYKAKNKLFFRLLARSKVTINCHNESNI